MTSTTIAAMKQALEALETHSGNYKLTKAECRVHEAVIDALRTAIEEEENKSLAEKPVLYTEVESEYWIAEDGSLL